MNRFSFGKVFPGISDVRLGYALAYSQSVIWLQDKRAHSNQIYCILYMSALV